MNSFPESVNQLIRELSRLPGIGQKTAQRLTFHILKSDQNDVERLARSLMDIKEKTGSCTICGAITETDLCGICSDSKRDDYLICIVEDAQDIYAFEKTNSFRGKYHVLGGVISPLDGIGPDDLNLEKLYDRIEPGTEIVLATNPSIEGDTTALYLAKVLTKKKVKITRLARGIPVGSEIEYMDEITLIRAMEGRTIL
ncbi:MAG: recombination mediator RecR [Candidatus Marinimicrobia bacterium]|nr:recombination mediator RecR [Candidatus Neomarinimicrobiota bacterium]